MFGQAIIWYLFLGGLGSGMTVVLCACDLLGARFVGRASRGGAALAGRPPLSRGRHPQIAPAARPAGGASSPNGRRRTAVSVASPFPCMLFSRGLLVATLALLMGLGCLMADLGRPERFFYVLVHPTLSVLTFGSYVLVATLLATLALCAISLLRPCGPRMLAFVRILEVAGLVAGVLTMAYTGVLLSQMGVVALWANPLLAPLFVASALSTGLAGALACLVPLDEAPRRIVHLLSRADLLVVALEAVLLAAYLGLAVAGGDGELVVRGLFIGPHAGLFWGGFVTLALVAPLALELVGARTGWTAPLGVAAACVLIGGYFLRYCLVNVPVV